MADVPLDRGARSSEVERAGSGLVGVRTFGPGSIVAYVLLIGLVLYFLTPIYWLAIASTKTSTDLYASFGLWIAHFNLWQNLSDTFTHNGGEYPRWLLNTVLYAVVGGFFSMFISLMGGYALAKYRFKGQNLIFGLVLGAVLVPQTTLALPIYLVLSKINLVNTYWAVLLPSLLSPVGVLLARIYAADAVSADLLDAARVDGAGELRTFFRIAIPLLVPGMVTIFLFQFVAIWNSFFLPLIVLSDPKLYPVNVGLATWNLAPAAHQFIYNLIVTGSLVAVIPLILLFLFLQRYWRAGLAFGSVTG